MLNLRPKQKTKTFLNIKCTVLKKLCYVVLSGPQSVPEPPPQMQPCALHAPVSGSPHTHSSRPSGRSAQEEADGPHRSDSRCRGGDQPGGGFEIWRSPSGVWDVPGSRKPGRSGRISGPCWGCPCMSHIKLLPGAASRTTLRKDPPVPPLRLSWVDFPLNSPHC